jgi:hypothetical protein
MKKLSLLLTLLPLVTQAQNIYLKDAEAYADSLVKKEILKEKGKSKLLKEIGGKSTEIENRFAIDGTIYTNSKPSKEAILKFCSRAFYEAMVYRVVHQTDVERKIVAQDSLKLSAQWVSLPPGTMAEEDLIHPNRSTIGFTRNQTLQVFKEIGLISDMVYQDCKKALEKGTVTNEVNLVTMMLDRSVYYTYYDFNLNKQHEYINRLAAAGILSPEAKVRVLNSYQPYELKSIPQILAYSHRSLVIDTDTLSADPKVAYPVIFRAIGELVPDFKYGELRVTMQEEKEDNMVRQDVTLRFKADSNEYVHTFFHDYRKEIPDPRDTVRRTVKVDPDFQKGVNKWFADRESKYRLHVVSMPDVGSTSGSVIRTSLVILREEEVDVVSKEPEVLSRESFDSRLNRKNMENLLQALGEQGLLGDMEQPQIDTLKQKLYADNIGSIMDLFDSIPHIIVPVYWETANLEDPYKELTIKLAAASRGVFTLSNITDDFAKGFKGAKKVKYGFTMNKKRYETMLNFKDDWLDDSFIELIRKAVKENKVNGDLYYCQNGTSVIFLSPEQLAFIQSNYNELFTEE